MFLMDMVLPQAIRLGRGNAWVSAQALSVVQMLRVGIEAESPS